MIFCRRRREFIAALGGAAAAWPLAARAQQGNRGRRVGVFVGSDENDPVLKTFVSAFLQALAGLGWTDGRNVRIDLRSWGGDSNRIRALAQELVSLQPDIILTSGTPATAAVQQEMRTIPIVFVNVGDPVASRIVARLDRPSGNVTGFALYESSLGGKWLELLSEIAPGLKRAAIIFNSDTDPASTYMRSFETAARSLKIVYRRRDRNGPHRPWARAGRRPCRLGAIHGRPSRAPIISAAARNNLPAIYAIPAFARDGGLLSYGPDREDIFRRAASYVDRMLRGEKPGDLPVQFPRRWVLPYPHRFRCAPRR